ncbi:MAG TPA: hypothetical protein VJ600_03775 [Holophagaceae bacterium]|nr:hypothetical protein [Holophagaceae bacterium]
MSSDDLARLRSFWWAPFLVLVLLDLFWPVVQSLGPGRIQGLVPVLIWIPAALLLGAELALLSGVWTRLKEGGAFQVLLGLQAALPLLWIVAGRFGLYRWLAGVGIGSGLGLLLFALFRDLAQVGFLAGAFHLRGQEPEDGPLGVLASAGLVVLGGGWVGVGLGSLLALFWKDPLPSELCGEGEAGAGRASLAGFLLLVAAPVVAIGWVIAWRTARMGMQGQWLTGPALLLAAFAWTLMGSRLGSGGKVWRILTWVFLGVALLLVLLMIALLFSFSGRGF